jgi:hypothetical protein
MPRGDEEIHIEEAGPDSDGIWEIRTMNQCYHSEAKYGTLSRSLFAREEEGEEGDS